ncbi:MAG: zinc-ribbon domain-containing protein, partial [Coriobacteriia bacterium]|nr:zinc-ribbon domain-containing protein [Coriobacteriia bacterium]
FGWGHSTEILGAGYTFECPNCHNAVTWLVARTSREACLFFVPVAKWQREYWMYCPICSAAAPLDSKEQAETLVALALRNDQLWLPAMVQRLTGSAP